ncbi:MAG: hypothetical protein JO288_21720, partial [Hyphomicrobiales bacterium]|nr:hypothetical protein [Hyphomicrobiales bacterium]
IMVFAHQGLEPRPPFGVAQPAAPAASAPVASAAPPAADAEASARPGLSPGTTRVLLDIGAFARKALDGGQASLAAPPAPGPDAQVRTTAASP